MRAIVNGEEMSVPTGRTISALVEDVTGSKEQRGIAVARNGEIVRRNEWSRTVEEGDEIEIVRAVQGG
ncbi:MAG TPA: sulfur carrier protein ThiS [Dehalococcoidia bacterium]|nr:sulfur carrier protein ThiS [Dehalococcoidia bacterium]